MLEKILENMKKELFLYQFYEVLEIFCNTIFRLMWIQPPQKNLNCMCSTVPYRRAQCCPQWESTLFSRELCNTWGQKSAKRRGPGTWGMFETNRFIGEAGRWDTWKCEGRMSLNPDVFWIARSSNLIL